MAEGSPTKLNGVKISVVDLPAIADNRLQKCEKKPEKIQQKQQGNSPQRSYMVMFFSELLGTAMLMFLGCMGGLTQFDHPGPVHHFGGITFGLTVMLIIQMFGHISGAHLNPAVTIATVLVGTVKPLMAVVYVVAQFVGATLGYGLLKLLAPSEYISEGFCATTIHSKITAVQGFGIEVVITTVLILICLSVWDKRNEDKPDSTPLRFGFAIAAISMAAGPLTGASMNTARTFAPLVFGGSWKDQWVYWIGPNIAAVIGFVIYKFLFALPEEKSLNGENIYLDETLPQNAEKV